MQKRWRLGIWFRGCRLRKTEWISQKSGKIHVKHLIKELQATKRDEYWLKKIESTVSSRFDTAIEICKGKEYKSKILKWKCWRDKCTLKFVLGAIEIKYPAGKIAHSFFLSVLNYIRSTLNFCHSLPKRIMQKAKSVTYNFEIGCWSSSVKKLSWILYFLFYFYDSKISLIS